MSKYIVKNCPAYRAGLNLKHCCKGLCLSTYFDGMDCTTITNCPIKQTIDKCRAIYKEYSNSTNTPLSQIESMRRYARAVAAQEILQNFELEEVQNG